MLIKLKAPGWENTNVKLEANGKIFENSKIDIGIPDILDFIKFYHLEDSDIELDLDDGYLIFTNEDRNNRMRINLRNGNYIQYGSLLNNPWNDPNYKKDNRTLSDVMDNIFDAMDPYSAYR